MGMVSLSLPTIPVVGEEFVNEKEPLLYVRWHERIYDKDDDGDEYLWHERQELKILGEDMKEGLSSSTGFQFFQKLVHRYDQERANRTKPKNKWAEDTGTNLYPSHEWTSRGDLLLNTTNVDYQRQVARVSWGQTLALKMGWVEEPTSGTFRLGPNLWQEFRSGTIPTPSDVQDANKQPTFWKVDGG